MVSQYPAELPGSTAAVLHSDVNKLDGEPEQTSVPAPVAAVTNVDALTLNSEPGVPNIKLPDTQKKPKEKGVSYFSLYRHADSSDILLMVLGTLSGLAAGAAMPMMTIIFGTTLQTLGGDPFQNVNGFLHQVNQVALYFTYLAIGSLVASYGEVAFWMWTGTRQANRIRQRFLTKALVMDVEYFDLHASSGHLMQGLNEDCNSIQNAISEKVGNTLHHVATFVVGIAIAFSKGALMTLVLLAVIPLLVVTVGLLSMLQGRLQSSGTAAYADANSLVQETFAAVRTVFACTASERMVQRYSQALVVPAKAGIRGTFAGALTVASLNGLFPLATALALWYGSTRVAAGDYTGGQVITVLLAAIVGGSSLGQAGPNIAYFQNGCVAAKRVFDIIHREPVIDEGAPGEELEAVKGELQFKGICFSYPSRPEVQVLSSLSFVVRAGDTVAFVGESGSGKSTIIQLLQRFYDPLQGQVLLDGHDIRQLQLHWYRHQLGLVSQEPVLFSTSISNNISYGNPGIDQAGIEAAAQAAHCHGFISKLPMGYDTPVGERGVQLSGGQKQRVAIARAIARNPRVLLLDEATAALDTRSERAVQAALDGLMTDRTTIIVAHRLSTIVNATSIAVVRDGGIVEQGSHAHLLEHHPQGAYATLLRLQLMAQEADKADALGANMLDAGPDDAIPPEALQQLQKRDSQERPISWRSGKAAPERPASLKQIVTEPVGESKPRTWKSRLPWWKPGKEPAEPKPKGASFWRLAQYNRPEWLWALLGTVGSAVQGGIMPAFAVSLSSLIGGFYSPDISYLKHTTTVWCLVLVDVGVIGFLATSTQQLGFGVLGQRLTRRMRVLLFKAVLRQEVAFFDKDEHSSGALSAELAVDTAHIRGAVGDQVGLVTQNVVTFIAAYVIALVSGWKLTLVLTAIIPLIVLASVIGDQFEQGTNATDHKLYAAANQTATEAFTSIRTVAAFSLGPFLSAQYCQGMQGPRRAGVIKANTAGGSFGTSQFVLYASYGLIFWYGGQLIKDQEITLTELLKVFFAIIFAAIGVSNAQQAFPDIGKAKAAIRRVFSTLDRVPVIDNASTEGLRPDKVVGHLDLERVSFSYPSRLEAPVFTDFCLTVEPGQRVALVGPSGSGKSTVVALIQRWYDPIAGRILLDGLDTRTLNLTWLRSCIGLVGQEPVLFSGTIAENIAYGCSAPLSQEELVEAARAANALSFIEKAPDGFSTQLGDAGGIALSGGQKQRVSIARALARNPRLLLLDEASSALDAASERLVQDALAKLQAGRTTLVIAHRLSTIRDASSIAVVQDGRVMEQGTHQQLMRKTGGSYASLVHQQRAA